MPGKKDISKLMPIRVMDKRGFMTTVYVRPGALKELDKETYAGDPEYEKGKDLVKDKFYPMLRTALGKDYEFKLSTNKASILRRSELYDEANVYLKPSESISYTITMPLNLIYKHPKKGNINIESFFNIDLSVSKKEGKENKIEKLKVKGFFIDFPSFPDYINTRTDEFYEKYVNKENLDKLVSNEKYGTSNREEQWRYNLRKEYPIMGNKPAEEFHKFITNVIKD